LVPGDVIGRHTGARCAETTQCERIAGWEYVGMVHLACGVMTRRNWSRAERPLKGAEPALSAVV